MLLKYKSFILITKLSKMLALTKVKSFITMLKLNSSTANATRDSTSLCILKYFLKWPDVFSFYVKIFAVNAKGLSSPVNIKTSTVKETSRLPLLPQEQSNKHSQDSAIIEICYFKVFSMTPMTILLGTLLQSQDPVG